MESGFLTGVGFLLPALRKARENFKVLFNLKLKYPRSLVQSADDSNLKQGERPYQKRLSNLVLITVHNDSFSFEVSERMFLSCCQFFGTYQSQNFTDLLF